jgi:hypothetical protein
MERVNWDALLSAVCLALKASSAQWKGQKSGGYNLVRFLEINGAEVVVRVPLQPQGGVDDATMTTCCKRYASEVATLRFLESNTKVPIPKLIHYNLSTNEVGSPYLVMEKVPGVPLCDVWDTMGRGKRNFVLKQVVNILLEMARHRFPRLGVLMPDGDGWTVEHQADVAEKGTPLHMKGALDGTYDDAHTYWQACSEALVRDASEASFGDKDKCGLISRLWCIRHFVIGPTINRNLDNLGFPLKHGDFNSQNVFIAKRNDPRITAIIDWEFSSTTATSIFAQYPLFIVNNPSIPLLEEREQESREQRAKREERKRLHARNLRDQAKFKFFIKRAKRQNKPFAAQLKLAFARCRNSYLLEQCVFAGSMDYGYLITCSNELFLNIFNAHDEIFVYDMLLNLERSSGFADIRKIFKEEEKVWKEAVFFCPDLCRTVSSLSRDEFIFYVKSHKGSFPEGGRVVSWLDMGLRLGNYDTVIDRCLGI